MEAKNSWKYWQDWNMKYFGELEEEDWFRYITILVRKHGKPCGINFAQLRYIHEVIVNSYNNNDNRPDHNIISEYLIRKKTTVISVYEPDECGEDEILTTYDGDDYQKMIEDGTVDDKYDSNCNKDTTGKKPIEIVKVTGKLTIWASPTHTAVDGGWVMTVPSYGSSGNNSSCPHKPDTKPDSSLIPPVNPDDDPIGDGDDREHYVDLDNLVSTDPNNWAYDGNSNNIPDALEWHMLH